jgi:excisionase family DNA binding protein
MKPTNAQRDPLVLTITEAAEVLRVSRRTVYYLLGRGDLRRVKLGKCARIPYQDVVDLINRSSKP